MPAVSIPPKKKPARNMSTVSLAQVRTAIERHWGFDSFRPLQQEAIESVLAERDSLVVLPTGGGKSLCFQAPAACLPGTAVVISPLIALMKDQVDALRENGIAAAVFNSSLSQSERSQVIRDLRAGQLKLLYLAPESLLGDFMLTLLGQVEVSLFAIDEAHCISSWGHDFRSEYRGLRVLKQRFPQVDVHAFTATATVRVQQDIVEQLSLTDPTVLVGSYDRPNLVYRVVPRQSGIGQLVEVIERHPHESGIIYCISRKEVERLAANLSNLGHKAVPYHAGLDDRVRKKNQEAFLSESVDIIVATVAFGMGIDKSNVRYVLHAGVPKSLEAYQQESGRAGRDRLEAECTMFYSGGDFAKWRKLLESNQNNLAGELAALKGMEQFCATPRCRHQLLVEHFGQELEKENCGACDICLGEFEAVEEPLVLAQKILSCIARLEQKFGAEYTCQVLTASRDKRILANSHDSLSTYGLLSDESQSTVRHWLEQLVGQGCAERYGEYQQLRLTELGRRVLRGEHTPLLTAPSEADGKVDPASWEGVDRELFEALRALRSEIAQEKEVAAYIVFGDASLRDLARRRPSHRDGFLATHGVGEKKWNDYGERFLAAIVSHCSEHGIAVDVVPVAPRKRKTLSASALDAFPMFAAGESISTVAHRLGRAKSTVAGYLYQYLQQEQATDPSPWVAAKTIQEIHAAIEEVGGDRLKPIFERLDGRITYEEIRIVATCLTNANS